jgi:hypothetical protein
MGPNCSDVPVLAKDPVNRLQPAFPNARALSATNRNDGRRAGSPAWPIGPHLEETPLGRPPFAIADTNEPGQAADSAAATNIGATTTQRQNIQRNSRLRVDPIV